MYSTVGMIVARMITADQGTATMMMMTLTHTAQEKSPPSGESALAREKLEATTITIERGSILLFGEGKFHS